MTIRGNNFGGGNKNFWLKQPKLERIIVTTSAGTDYLYKAYQFRSHWSLGYCIGEALKEHPDYISVKVLASNPKADSVVHGLSESPSFIKNPRIAKRVTD